VFARSFTDAFAHLYRPEDLAEFLSGMGPDLFAEEIADQSSRFRLAEDEGNLAGYAKLAPPRLPVETPPDTIELNQLYVLKPWQGSGVAAALMEWAIETARSGAIRHIQLSVYVGNDRARRFYERHGFHAVGRYDFVVGSHVDEDLVLRHLVLDREQ
jgi:ribosomal protein S18 acetylase RimI-like enzyme